MVVWYGSVHVRNQSKPTKLFRTELEILNVQSEQQQQRDDNLRLTDLNSCPANLLFVELTQLGLQNQKRLMHALNDPSTNIRPANSSKDGYPLGTYFCMRSVRGSLLH